MSVTTERVLVNVLDVEAQSVKSTQYGSVGTLVASAASRSSGRTKTTRRSAPAGSPRTARRALRRARAVAGRVRRRALAAAGARGGRAARAATRRQMPRLPVAHGQPRAGRLPGRRACAWPPGRDDLHPVSEDRQPDVSYRDRAVTIGYGAARRSRRRRVFGGGRQPAPGPARAAIRPGKPAPARRPDHAAHNTAQWRRARARHIGPAMGPRRCLNRLASSCRAVPSFANG